jgi:hypothetical protein
VKAAANSKSAKEVANLMYDTALLTSGFDVESPKAYATKVYGMMGMAISKDTSASGSTQTKDKNKKSDGPVEADQVIEEK